MKITEKDLLILKTFVMPVFDKFPNIVEDYEAGKFPRSDKVKDLQKRFCFDVLYFSGCKLGDGVGIHGDINLYAYAHNEHLYTALKSFCPKVTKKYD